MKLRVLTLLTLVVFVGAAGHVFAQQTGDIAGKVTDNTGAVLPGVTVTLTGAAASQTAVSSATGTFVFPRLTVGTYSVKFELAGFKTVVREGIRVTINARVEVSQILEISTVQETVTVTGASPVVDTSETGTQATYNREMLQSIPSARDPWVILEQTPGITLDRANIGGSQSGQQSGYVSRGSSTGNNKWTIDGVDITDMSATGASPIYYDFDMLEEMQIVTGGADASQQTGGVGINMVTRSGGDKFKGSGRYYLTDNAFQSDNVTDAIRRQGAQAGNPIQNIKDYGFEVGGPIMKGKLWYWGSYGKQDIKVGVLGFYKATPTCRPTPPTDTEGLRACLETDLTVLNNYNWKIDWAVMRNNKFSFQNTWAEKIRNARDASDTRPMETTFRQMAATSKYGKWGWNTGPSPLWKAGDRHIFSDRLLFEVNWAHLGNNFILDFQEDALNTVQPIFNQDTGVWARSYQRAGPYIRPTHSVDAVASYFLPGTAGGDHAFKVGFRWRTAPAHSETHWGGNTVARYNNAGLAVSADLYRDAVTEYDLKTWAAYLQDTFTRDRLTVKFGLRYDRQSDAALPSSVPAHPFAPEWLPAVSFKGANTGIVWNNFSPRVSATYDLTGRGKSVINASWAVYYGQMAPGTLAFALNPVTQASIRFPWTDLNGDKFVTPNELTYYSPTTGAPAYLTFGGNYNPLAPTSLTLVGSVDPNIKNDRTQEIITGFDHELFRGIGIGVSYIWRKYDQFAWSDRKDFTSADYTQRTFTPTCTVSSARCSAITYWEPTKAIPAAYVYTNVPDRYRNFNGVEATIRRHYADRWMMSASYAYNSAVDKWDSPSAYEDPTNLQNLNGAQFAPLSGGSGIDNIYTNAKWLVKVTGLYTPIWDINLSAFFNARQGYPAPLFINTPSRANAAGIASVFLDKLGDNRLSNFWTLDFKVEKAFNLGGKARIIPSIDVFNVANANTTLSVRRNQAAGNANNISSIVGPRILRFGVRATW